MSKLTLKAGRPSDRGGAARAKMLAELADRPAKPKRVNFDLDKERHRRLKLLAAQQGKTITDILRALVDRELTANPDA